MSPSKVSLPDTDIRVQITNRLRGQTIHLPDLLALYPGWPHRLHPGADEARRKLEEWFAKYIPNGKDRHKQRQVDNALLAGYFWSRVPTERLQTLTELLAWYFYWDDEIDCGSLQLDAEGDKAEKYRRDTVAFLQHCIEPDLYGPLPVDDGEEEEQEDGELMNGGGDEDGSGRLKNKKNGARRKLDAHTSGGFVGVGRNIQEGQSDVSRRRFARVMYDYVNAVCSHQGQRQVGISTVESYVKRRFETIGVYGCLTIMEWGYGLNNAPWVYEHEAMQVIIRETARGSFLYNDLMSIKKEVRDYDIDSLIPILVHNQNLTAQQAADKVVDMMRSSYAAFDAAEKRMLAFLDDDHHNQGLSEQEKKDVRMLIEGCKDLTLGGLYWSYATERYLPRSCFHGNEITITL